MKEKTRFILLAGVLLIFFFPLVIAGCGAGEDNPFGDLTAVVTGIVTGPDGEPLQGVTVTLWTESDTTESDGSYYIDGLSYGEYTIKATKAGFNNYTSTIYVFLVMVNQDIQMTHI